MSGVKQIDGYKIYMSKMLGQGSYGAVYIGISDKTGEEVAVKILKKKSSKNSFKLSWCRWVPEISSFQWNQNHANIEIW